MTNIEASDFLKVACNMH